jgi:integrase
MSKTISGLQYDKKTKHWSIDKRIKGHGRIRQRLKAKSTDEAETEFYKIIADLQVSNQRTQDGIMTFNEAATRYVNESTKRSLDRDIVTINLAKGFIGSLTLSQIHMGTLQALIESRRKDGIRSATVKRDLAVIRRILTLAARSWRNNDGHAYLSCPPLLEMPDWEDSAIPYPLDWQEQQRLFEALPSHLAAMALFAVNTGLREQGVCWLRWDWEVKIPGLDTSIFITPGRKRTYSDGVWPGEKNKEDQMVVLNRVAKSVIDAQRGKHDEYVFPYSGKRITRIHNTGWKNAWKKAGLPKSDEYNRGPHNLKHTFGRRLRNAGVPLETRKVLLHHTNGDITIHYSPAEVSELIEAVERIVDQKPSQILRRVG